MIKTLPINQLEKKADNIYEAIIVLAKRARQINNDQKAVLNQGHDFDDDYDEFADDEIFESTNEDYEKLPKPSTIALDEFFDGKIKFSYRENDDEDGAPESETKK